MPSVFRLFRHYVSTMLLAVVGADLCVLLGAVVLSNLIEGWIGPGPLGPKVLALAAITLFTFYVADLYEIRRPMGHREIAARLLVAVSCAAILEAAVGFALPTFQFGRRAFLQIFSFTSIGLLLWRTAWIHLRSHARLQERVLVLGLGRWTEGMLKLESTSSQLFTIIGFLDDDPGAYEALPAGAELLGKSQDLLNLAEELQPDLVVVALRDMRGSLPAKELLECRLRGIRVEDWPTFYEKQTGKILVTDLRPSWLIFADGFVKTHLTQTIKRSLDLVLASVGLLFVLPVMALVALAIKLDSQGPMLFRQERVGQNGRLFTLKKFRSMYQDAEKRSGPVWAAADDPRITRVGRVVRRTRLDELPQLFNVLMGEMSFIGPRPERPEFVRMLQRQIPFYMQRLSVKPGITGWAQVRHQYAASVEDTLEKLQYDLYYIKNLSLFLDLLILLSTIQVVLFGRGAR
jgi:sugar transferase (PEP-CTERM system associated)